jgi:hypothetical protein
MFHSDPVFLLILGVLAAVFFFFYLLLRRTVLAFREGTDGRK